MSVVDPPGSAHQVQDLNYHGMQVQVCQVCGLTSSAPDFAMPCRGKPQVVEKAAPVPQNQWIQTAAPAAAMNAADIIKSLDAAVLGERIAELEAEVAGMRVLLAAAKTRDEKKKTGVK